MLLPAFNKIAMAYDVFDQPSDVGLSSALLNSIIYALPALKGPVKELMGAVSLKEAAAGNKDTMWHDPERYPAVDDAHMVRVDFNLTSKLTYATQRYCLS